MHGMLASVIPLDVMRFLPARTSPRNHGLAGNSIPARCLGDSVFPRDSESSWLLSGGGTGRGLWFFVVVTLGRGLCCSLPLLRAGVSVWVRPSALAGLQPSDRIRLLPGAECPGAPQMPQWSLTQPLYRASLLGHPPPSARFSLPPGCTHLSSKLFLPGSI